MTITSIILFLVVGAIAGWLAGRIMKSGGFGLVGNIIVGIIGAVIGGYIFNFLRISAGGFIGSLITALIGAILLLFIIKLIKKSVIIPKQGKGNKK